VLSGGKGDDLLNGGHGDDVLTGGQNRDTFVFGPDSGDDVITDFHKSQDEIRFEGVAGVDDFSDLVFSASGGNVLISWGTGDSILLEGTRLKDIDPSSFSFG
jgi:Ca2+-binding RTX toxin-like protein